jgi:methylthioribose-1-phosphate isomerase
MNVQGKHYRSLWWDEAESALEIVDQTALPHAFLVVSLRTLDEVCEAIRSMRVRGAPLIGVCAAYGLAIALREDASPQGQKRAAAALLATRPTAINLRWALDRVQSAIASSNDPAKDALACATRLADEDVEVCRAIGANGLSVARALWDRRAAGKERLEFLTHCNAGWLATVDWGTALSCVYQTYDAGIPVHVWVDETRPRSQGARLTAWELGQHGVPHTLVADVSAGHLMQRGLVDLCVVGSDRTTAQGDVCNKIGTYPLALAAKDNSVPFYVALPYSSIDWEIQDALAEIPIEERDAREVTHVGGRSADGSPGTVAVAPQDTRAVNYAFDVTPARLVTSLITERGVFPVTPGGLLRLAQARHAT